MSYNNEENGDPTADQDLPLVVAAQAGDLQAFERLILRHQKRMLNIACRITNDQDDAIEVVQDAFVSAFRNLKGFRRDARFSTWLTSITMNLSRNRRKQMQIRQARVPVSLDEPIRTDDGDLLPDPPSKDPSGLDLLEKRDVSGKVRDCISALDPGFREVIVLRDMQDLAYEEIGEVLKIAIGTVKSRLFRARDAVKECLKKALGAL
jgi:RNA polymerase sigma-70 factor (ECF subfamily)